MAIRRDVDAATFSLEVLRDGSRRRLPVTCPSATVVWLLANIKYFDQV